MRISSLLPSVFVVALIAFGAPAFAAAAPATPGNLEIVGGKYTNDATPTFTWSKVAGAEKYDYRVNNNDYIGTREKTTVTLDTLRDGWYTIAVRAHSGDQWSKPATFTFEIDTTGPTISDVAPATATVGVPTSFSVTATGDAWVASCHLTMDGVNMGEMSRNGNTFKKTSTLTTTGKHRVEVTCLDGDGNTSTSRSTLVNASASSTAAAGDVIKEQTSPVVYYYGDDGKRHAFPSESVFRTWYDNFSAVRTVPASFIAALPIGANVTVRPGSMLVKFQSAADVYAVGMGAKLHHYTSEALVKLDYGTAWQTVLLTLPDLLRSNYTIGTKIDNASDFDPQKSWDTTPTIDELF